MKQKISNRHLQIAIFLLIALVFFAIPWQKAHAQERVDILVLYTPEALETRNGRDIQARIASSVEYTNQAFRNSGINMTLRVVGTRQLNTGLTHVTNDNLNRLRQDPQVTALRRELGADIVTLLNLRQPTQGGYVCGVGYLVGGSSATGTFNRGVNGWAYNLVGVDCGLSTFAHELGHNMGLGHSQRQNSNGGVWPWARGYGVDGLFATIMAYPHSFGTNNQLQLFSTPARRDCRGVACGVDRTRSDGADAAGSLNLLAPQIAQFMPTVVAVDEGGGTVPSPGPSPAPTPSPCATPALAGSLLQNGVFNTVQGWQAAFDAGRLAIEQQARGTQASACVESVLAVVDRREFYAGAQQSLAGKIRGGSRYRLQGQFAVRGTARANVNFALRRNQGGAISYAYLTPFSAANTLSDYSVEFVAEASDIDALIIYGPAAGVDMLMDNVSLVALGTGAAQPTAPVYVLDETFEGRVSGWSSFYGGNLSLSTLAAEGRYSLLSSRRTSRYAGPMVDLSGQLRGDHRYALSLQARLSSSVRNADELQLWVYYEDQRGAHWLEVVRETLSINQWQSLAAEFSIPAVGELQRVRLHMLGAAAGTDIRVDNVRVRE